MNRNYGLTSVVILTYSYIKDTTCKTSGSRSQCECCCGETEGQTQAHRSARARWRRSDRYGNAAGPDHSDNDRHMIDTQLDTTAPKARKRSRKNVRIETEDPAAKHGRSIHAESSAPTLRPTGSHSGQLMYRQIM